MSDIMSGSDSPSLHYPEPPSFGLEPLRRSLAVSAAPFYQRHGRRFPAYVSWRFQPKSMPFSFTAHFYYGFNRISPSGFIAAVFYRQDRRSAAYVSGRFQPKSIPFPFTAHFNPVFYLFFRFRICRLDFARILLFFSLLFSS